MSKKDIAIKVENLSKEFIIPHEKQSTLKGAALNIFKRKNYEKFKALHNVSFEIKKGEFFGIIGRNGSGKSTLLKILAGIYMPDSGSVVTDGKISPFLELGVGFNDDLTARENVFLGSAILGLSKKEVEEKFDAIIRFAELEEFIDMKLKNFSSGMQVRLAFALAINVRGEILLMDEVLAVGDVNFQSKCIDEFNKYREQGKTIILVTHDIEVVRKYCDRAMLLRSGLIYSIGKADEVCDQYIEQNIKDEEERILERSEDSQIDKKKKKKVDIVDCQIFAVESGKAKRTFRTGEKMSVKISYRFNEGINNPIFGIVIKDILKRQVFVANTVFKKINVGQVNKGNLNVTFIIENLFASGEYYLSPAIADNARRIIDWKEEILRFNVINKEFNSGGVVDFSHEIKINRKHKI